MRWLQFRLRHMLVATAVIGLVVNLTLRFPGVAAVCLRTASIFGLSLVFLYLFSRLPYRVRLSAEVATALFLLALLVWVRRCPAHLVRSHTAQEYSEQAERLAATADTKVEQDRFLRRAAWLRGLAWDLRWEALTHGMTQLSKDPEPIGGKELIYQLSILEELERRRRVDEGVVDD